jgi:hypothetical protein
VLFSHDELEALFDLREALTDLDKPTRRVDPHVGDVPYVVMPSTSACRQA